MFRYNFPHRKEKRRAEALERQKQYDKKSTKDKLAQLDQLGVIAGKQRAKLIARLEKENA